jgi:hypothetical protein
MARGAPAQVSVPESEMVSAVKDVLARYREMIATVSRRLPPSPSLPHEGGEGRFSKPKRPLPPCGGGSGWGAGRMPGKTPAERAALEAQGAVILRVFEAAGFVHIAPDILQPADVFLDRAGEEIRARTFVFTDPAGTELCLRPDLTVPACRYHLSHSSAPDAEARYCYQGPAFRFQPEGGLPLYPSEFDQAGIEWFGAAEPERADAEVLGLTVAAMAAAGLERYRVRIGDLGLVRALLHSIDMPERWRRRLMHQFWRPRAFRSLLDQLTGARAAAHLDLAAARPAGRRRSRRGGGAGDG